MADVGTIERVEGVDLIRWRATDLHVYAPASRAGAPAGTAPTTVGAARETLVAAGLAPYALLDGAMFDLCAPGTATYATTTCDRLGYLARDRARGIDLPVTRGHEGRGGTLAVVGGRFATALGARVPDGASVAVQGYPSLVLDGVVVAGEGANREVTWRAAVVQFDDRTGAFAVWRGPMHDFAVKLRNAGARWAVYTDGGGSTRLVDGRGNWRGSTENRRVASVLFAAAPAGTGGVQVRTTDGALVPDGAGGGMAARGEGARVVGLSSGGKAVAVVGLGALLWRWMR